MATASLLLTRQLGRGPAPSVYALCTHTECESLLLSYFKTNGNASKENQLSRSFEKLLKEFFTRFKDYEFHEHSYEIFSSPFHTDIDKAPVDIQLELIDLQHRTDLNTEYVKMDLGGFYRKYLDQEKFPNLRNFMAYNKVFFGSTYSCEQFFSKLGFMKFACRAVMTGEHLENGFRVARTSTKVNLNRVVQIKSQLHVSY